MPKHLLSKRRLSEFKDLIQNVKQPKRIDIILNRKKQKDIEWLRVEKINDKRRLSKLSWKPDGKLHLSLEKMLQDKRTLKPFCDFLRSEFSDENIEFWLACEDYKLTIFPDDRRWKAEQIYEKFIRPTACREINVDHHIREEIKRSLENPNLSLFDEAQKHIYMLMERDSCPRFLHSDAYLSLTHKSMTLWYI